VNVILSAHQVFNLHLFKQQPVCTGKFTKLTLELLYTLSSNDIQLMTKKYALEQNRTLTYI
jgi:hypothetical protein